MFRAKYLLPICMLALLCGCAKSSNEALTASEASIVKSVTESVDKTVSSVAEEKALSEDQQAETSGIEAEIKDESKEPSFDIIPEVYAYSLTISINPLVELYFDSNNVVVGIGYLNQDAIDAYKDTEIIGHTLDSGISAIVEAASKQGYIKEDATIEIELSKVADEAEEAFDTSVLIDAAKCVTEALEETNKASDESKEIAVELAVNETVAEGNGIIAPTICEDCNGTGNNCSECNGTAIVRCKRCSSGVETCGICNGLGSVKCHGCHGAGGDCNYCGGLGTVSCEGCGGYGAFNCSWCGGALEHVCPICWGAGSCPTCGGDGIK